MQEIAINDVNEIVGELFIQNKVFFKTVTELTNEINELKEENKKLKEEKING